MNGQTDKETDNNVSELKDLISEGKELQKRRPRSADFINSSDEDFIKGELECHKWCTKTKTTLAGIFGENSRQLKSFASNYADPFVVRNLLGIGGTEITFVYENVGKGIAELEVLAENLSAQKPTRSQSAVNVVDFENKLSALRKNVDQWLHVFHHGQAINFDPKDVSDLFSRYQSLSNPLRSMYPSYFDDLPIRHIELSGTNDFEGRGYVHRKRLEVLLMDIDYCLNILSRTTAVNVPKMKVTREGLFFSGQYFDAVQAIADILSNARQSIMIVDNWVNEKVLSLLTAKKPSVDVKILTKEISPALGTTANEFNKQYGGLHIRTSAQFHDRFVVIDGNDFYHFGASIKDLGKKGFMFSRIEEPEITKSLSKRLSEEWEKAKAEIQP